MRVYVGTARHPGWRRLGRPAHSAPLFHQRLSRSHRVWHSATQSQHTHRQDTTTTNTTTPTRQYSTAMTRMHGHDGHRDEDEDDGARERERGGDTVASGWNRARGGGEASRCGRRGRKEAKQEGVGGSWCTAPVYACDLDCTSMAMGPFCPAPTWNSTFCPSSSVR